MRRGREDGGSVLRLRALRFVLVIVSLFSVAWIFHVLPFGFSSSTTTTSSGAPALYLEDPLEEEAKELNVPNEEVVNNQPARGKKGANTKGGNANAPPLVGPKQRLRIDYLCSPHIALLPTVAYGGAEASCEAEIEGLSKLYNLGCVEMVAVVPHRETYNHTYTFPIMEVGNVGDHGPDFIKGYVKKLKERSQEEWPHMIWCQSEWCPITLRQQGINIPLFATNHFGECAGVKDLGPTVRYRLPSKFNHEACKRTHPWLQERGFTMWQAFKDSEFDLSEDEGDYVLWVGGCGWYNEKGIPQFQELAVRNPDLKFVIHCSGEDHWRDKVRAFAANHPNYEYRGELLRGKPHNEAFKRARFFFFWTHMQHETFGRVAVEALAKGTPVIGSTHAANPETIIDGKGGITTEDLNVASEALRRKFDRRAVFETAQRFRSTTIVRALLVEAKAMLRSLRQQDLVSTDVDQFPVLAELDDNAAAGIRQCWPRTP